MSTNTNTHCKELANRLNTTLTDYLSKKAANAKLGLDYPLLKRRTLKVSKVNK